MVRQISVQDLAKKLAGGESIYLLDVRKPWEHELAALPGSRLIPLDELGTRAAEIDPPAGALVIVYCHHGIRSLSAASFLDEHGLKGVVSLAGGIDAWSTRIDARIPRY